MNSVAAGWYPIEQDPTTERYWDGTQWTDSYRPAGPAVAPPPAPGTSLQVPIPASGKQSRPFYKKKRFVIPVALLAVIVVASIASGGGSGSDGSDTAAASDATESSDSSTQDSEATDDEEPAEDVELGTAENPYPFGQAHTREAGLLGAGWTLSIDEVRTEGIGYNQFFVDEGETRTCIAVIGSATLDSLDSEELTSNPFSFPSPVLIVDGTKVDGAIGECDTEGLKAEGLTWILDTALAPGGSTKWFEVYLVDSIEYDTVAVESTIYAQS